MPDKRLSCLRHEDHLQSQGEPDLLAVLTRYDDDDIVVVQYFIFFFFNTLIQIPFTRLVFSSDFKDKAYFNDVLFEDRKKILFGTVKTYHEFIL